jgi:hypothetical protein
MLARIAMIATTTSNSIRVKPFRGREISMGVLIGGPYESRPANTPSSFVALFLLVYQHATAYQNDP